jgi:parallel beta-helix repeat protein
MAWMGLAGCLAIRAAGAAVPDTQGHEFGKWPTIGAVIHDEQQKDLNLDGRDFLIEVWFQPLATLQYKGDILSVLMAKKGADRLAGYSLSYTGSGLGLTLCDQTMELDDDRDFTAEAGLATNEWSYIAVSYSRKARTLTFFKNGRKLKEYTKVELGDLSNREPFSIACSASVGNTPAHCRIREARLWKLSTGVPEGLDALIAAHHRDPGQVSDALTRGAAYSRWVFGPGNDDVTDQGNSGNTLCTMPYGYKGPPALQAFPATPAGKTAYVDNRHPQATDAGAGTREQPFKTIKRGLKATQPGDVLHIGAGVYRESVLPRAGENGKPVTVEGEDGTLITGSDPIPGWERQADGLWTVTNWVGKYEPPMDPKESDARSDAGNLFFVDDEPMDFVKTRLELTPGTWTAEPIMGRGPKTLRLYPLPGTDPNRVPAEITVGRGITLNGFTHLRNLHVTRGGVNLRGRRNLLENCTLSWSPFVCLGIGGQDQIVRNNRILWGANSGVGGSSARLLFENNRLSYNGWRNYGAGWHGGAIKLIPGNTDHVMRNNELCYNDIAAIWYDAWNQGNLIEGNVCRDNSGHGGIFEEISFGNTIRSNLCYNNYGHGLHVAETSEDRLYRNIAFNNYGAGLFFRSGGGEHLNPPQVATALQAEYGEKLDVRRYQGLVTYEREKQLRDMVTEYWCRYSVRSPGKLNTVIENAIFDNWGWGGIEVNQLVRYAKGVPVNTNLINHYAGNVYWNRTNVVIFSNGAHCTRDLDFKTWQELSGQDQDSRFMNPWTNLDKMPAWFRERFTFKEDDFRPIVDVMDGPLANLRKSTARTVLMSRLVRSKTLTRLAFSDPTLFGYLFEMDGQRCVSLWSKGVAERDFLLPGITQVAYESKYLKRTPVNVAEGRVRILVGDDPVTLIGIGETVKEDRSVGLTVPMWNEPGKPVAGKLVLENADPAPREYDLTVGVGAGWTIGNSRIRKTLGAGETLTQDVTLTPPGAVRQGMFRVQVSGTAGKAAVALSRSFGIGSLLVLKPVDRKLTMDGDLSDWDPGIPNGMAEAKEQVVAGAENWKGPDDLSAKVWLRWNEARELYVAIEVTDDQLVVKEGKDAALLSDSVQVMVDVRAEWKHFMKDCTPGTFTLTLVPGTGTQPATATYGRLRVGSIRGVASRKTEKGYIIEVDIHFHTAEVEDPGWVANRAIRLGVLVNDVDGQGRKATIGAWRTAADAADDCSSLTPFMTEK